MLLINDPILRLRKGRIQAVLRQERCHCQERSDAAISIMIVRPLPRAVLSCLAKKVPKEGDWGGVEFLAPASQATSCCGARQKQRMTKHACFLPTAATRSPSLICHRQRSGRSPQTPPGAHLRWRSMPFLFLSRGEDLGELLRFNEKETGSLFLRNS